MNRSSLLSLLVGCILLGGFLGFAQSCFAPQMDSVPGVQAQEPITNGINELGSQVNLPGTVSSDIRQTLTDLINFLLSFLSLIAVITIIVAGFVLIFGMGSEGSATRAKKIILYTIIGLLIIFFARVIVGFFTGEIAGIFSS